MNTTEDEEIRGTLDRQRELLGAMRAMKLQSQRITDPTARALLEQLGEDAQQLYDSGQRGAAIALLNAVFYPEGSVGRSGD